MDSNQLFELAEIAVLEGRWDDANVLFEGACSEEPTPEIRIAYGVCLAEQEKFYDAISQFCHVLDCSDIHAKSVVMHNLACIYRELDEHAMARRFQQLAISLSGECGCEELLGVANDAYLDGNDALASSLMEMIDSIQSPDTEPDLNYLATQAVISAADTRNSLLQLFAVYNRRPRHECRRRGIDLMNLAILFATLGRVRSQRRCLEMALTQFAACEGGYSFKKLQRQLRTSEDSSRLLQKSG